METKQMYSNAEKIEKFSDWLRYELITRHITVRKLSRMSGVHINTIHNYLHEKCEPSLYNVTCIVNALGYDLGVMRK